MMASLRWVLVISAVLSSMATPLLAQQEGGDPKPVSDRGQALQALHTHCWSCHGGTAGKKLSGGLDLTVLERPGLPSASAAALWTALHARVSDGTMPPEEITQRPSAAELASIAAWVRQYLAHPTARAAGPTMRRLNRHEYAYALSDIVGIAHLPDPHLPQDPPRRGFENNGAALHLSAPVLMRYVEHAERVLKLVIPDVMPSPSATYARVFSVDTLVHGPEHKTDPQRKGVEKHRASATISAGAQGRGVRIISGGLDISEHPFRGEGDYRFRLDVVGHPGKDGIDPRLTVIDQLAVGDERILYSDDVHGVSTIEFRVRLNELTASASTSRAARKRPIQVLIETATFSNVALKPNANGDAIDVRSITIEGPIAPSAAIARMLPRGLPAKPDEAYATSIIQRVAEQAFRRPVPSPDIEPFTGIYRRRIAAGDTFAQALRTALSGVLCSPRFLFLVEPVGELDDYSIATRLAQFLWSSLPDQELRALAASGKLRDAATRRAQAARMLDDPRAVALIDQFAEQWLELGRFDQTPIDPKLYPSFTLLRRDLREEPKEFMREVLSKNLSIHSFISSDFLVINDRLAQHYGYQGVVGGEFRRVALPAGDVRGGLLGMGAFSVLTSNGARTSPVHRGVWVRNVLFDDPAPPPPPNAGDIEPNIPGAAKLSVRQRLDKHRNTPGCMECHTRIDPYGFALDRFDVLGRWRERDTGEDGDKPILGKEQAQRSALLARYPLVDDSGTLSDGTRIQGPAGLRQIFQRNDQRFPRAFTAKLLRFALGRDVVASDRPALDALVAEHATDRSRIRSVIAALVAHPIFIQPMPQQ